MPASPGISERAFLAQVRELARLKSWATFHPLRSDNSEPGWPDLALCKPPFLWFLELKSERGRVTLEQQQWVDRLNLVRLVGASIMRPSDFSQIEKILTKEVR